MKLLEAEAIREGMAGIPGWRRRGAVLRREWTFTDFAAAMKFVNATARIAEKAQHHPDINIRWNRVSLALTTHDAGGLTAADFSVAAACDRAAEKTLKQA